MALHYFPLEGGCCHGGASSSWHVLFLACHLKPLGVWFEWKDLEGGARCSPQRSTGGSPKARTRITQRSMRDPRSRNGCSSTCLLLFYPHDLVQLNLASLSVFSNKAFLLGILVKIRLRALWMLVQSLRRTEMNANQQVVAELLSE